MNHRHQLSTTAAAGGLQLGSGLRRIVCLAALLFIFVAGVRAQYPITETTFPDKNFYNVVLKNYSMFNGSVFVTNPAVTSMEVKSLTIRDLTGIGLFPLLQTLDCSNNQLRSADLQYNVYLTTVTIYKNQLYGTGMDTFIQNLFDRSQQPTKGELRIIYNEASTGNKMTSAQVEAAKKRGWTPKMSTNGTTWTDYPGSDAIAINATNFPDANFREWLLEQSYGVDGYLSTPEIAAVTKIDVSYESISSLKGIEYFTALTNLDCCHNQLTSLDVSKNTALTNLRCFYNKLTSLNVLNNTAMTNLECNHNELTSLNVSQNKMLKTLGCEENKLTSLDVSACTALETLLCHDNQLTSLNVSKNTEMETLRCFGNQLTSLNVSNCTALTELNCVRNNLASLDVSNNTALTNLTCTNNKLTSLNVSNNTALTGLYCGSNQLTSLNVSKNTELTNLTCSNNQLTALDLSQNTVLTDLRCYSNELTSLDVTKCTALINLFCYKNMIRGAAMTNLVKSLPDIETGTLWVHYDETPEGNMMTPKQVKVATDKNWSVLSYDHGLIIYEGEPADGIEISEENFPDDAFREYVGSKTIDKDEDGYLSDEEIDAVTEINVSYLNISDLKGIEFFNGLKELNCSYNQLTSLDVSHNRALTRLYCYCNRIRGTDMTKLVNSLPDRKSETEKGTLWVYYIDDSPAGNMMTPGQVEIAREKNWNVVMWDDDYEDFIPYEGETLDGIEISEANFPDDNFRAYVSSENIDRDENGYLSDEEIEAVTEIDVMYMDIEDLTGIGYFTALKTLYAGRNKLTELDLSKNTALDYLGCSDNQLTELDLGENTALTTLYCGGNQLTELDLTNNTKLESVNICNSQIYGEAMDRLIESLPTRTVGLGFGRFYAVDTNSETEGNIITKLQKHNLSAKRWSTLNARGNGYYPETIPGDFNGDGLVNTQDIDCLRDYILGIKSGMYIFTEAELTDDLKADIVDLTKLIEILLKR